MLHVSHDNKEGLVSYAYNYIMSFKYTPVLSVHILSNSCYMLKSIDYFLQGRSNVVLLGDSVTDVKMLSGLDRVDHVIKIGFLNHNVSLHFV